MACMTAFRVAALAGVASVAIGSLAPIAGADHLLGWDFDEASGPALDNGADPANNGTLFGGAMRSTDTPSGTGFSIDLRDDDTAYDYVATDGDADQLDGLSALTLTTWLKLEEYPGTGSSANSRLAAKQAPSSFGGFNWSLNATVPAASGAASAENVTMALFLGGGTGFAFDIADDASFDASEWTFLATTWDAASGTVSFYTGGVGTPVTLLSSGNIDAGTLSDTDVAFGVGFTGAAPTSDTSAIGFQDDVRVYGDVLDLAALEAARLSNVPEPTSAFALFGAAGALGLRRRR